MPNWCRCPTVPDFNPRVPVATVTSLWVQYIWCKGGSFYVSAWVAPAANVAQECCAIALVPHSFYSRTMLDFSCGFCVKEILCTTTHPHTHTSPSPPPHTNILSFSPTHKHTRSRTHKYNFKSAHTCTYTSFEVLRWYIDILRVARVWCNLRGAYIMTGRGEFEQQRYARSQDSSATAPTLCFDSTGVCVRAHVGLE